MARCSTPGRGSALRAPAWPSTTPRDIEGVVGSGARPSRPAPQPRPLLASARRPWSCGPRWIRTADLGWRHAAAATSRWPRSTRPWATWPATRTRSAPGPARAAPAGAHLVALPETVPHRLPGRGSRLAQLLRRRLYRRRSTSWPLDLARRRPGRPTGRRGLPRRRPRARHRAGRARPRARARPARTAARTAPKGMPQAAPPSCTGEVLARYAKYVICPVYGEVFDEFGNLRAGDELTVLSGSGCRRSPWPSVRTLAGRRAWCKKALAGRRAAPGDQRLCCTSRTRTRPLAPHCAPAGEADDHAGLRQSCRGPGRAGLDGDRLVVDVREGAGPRPATPGEDLLVVDLDLKSSTVDPVNPPPGVSTWSSPPTSLRRTPAADTAAAPRSSPSPRSTPR